METQVVIKGAFRVAKCEKNDYGLQATIVEMLSNYPQSFSLSLPDGTLWQKGDEFMLTLETKPRTLRVKSSGSNFLTFDVTKVVSQSRIKVTVTEVKEVNKPDKV